MFEHKQLQGHILYLPHRNMSLRKIGLISCGMIIQYTHSVKIYLGEEFYISFCNYSIKECTFIYLFIYLFIYSIFFFLSNLVYKSWIFLNKCHQLIFFIALYYSFWSWTYWNAGFMWRLSKNRWKLVLTMCFFIRYNLHPS